MAEEEPPAPNSTSEGEKAGEEKESAALDGSPKNEDAADADAADGTEPGAEAEPEMFIFSTATETTVTITDAVSHEQQQIQPPSASSAAAAMISDSSPPPPTQEEEEPSPSKKYQKPKQAVVAPLPLDWTRMNECDAEEQQENAIPIRHPWDVMQIDPTETNLTVVGTHGQKITRMGADLYKKVSPDLTELVLRSHLIRTMEGIGGMKNLELLELYDNMVDELRELDGSTGENGDEKSGGDGLPGKNLRVLDISYNVIRDMRPVNLCPNLQELYIAQNKIKSIKGLKHLKLLRKVDLGANRIRTIDEDELSGLENLEELWLGKNKIQHITGLSKLTKLRKLDVQSNRLTKIENLEAQVDTLEELYLAHNGITVEGAKCETGLALNFTQLNTVDLTRNRLTDTSPFVHLTPLTDLWISGNDIKTFEDVEPLRALTELDSVYLEYNPVASEFEYRKKLAEIIPSLTQIDANMIGGIGQHGYISAGGGGGLVERMRQMQEAAIQKAEEQMQQQEIGEQKPAAVELNGVAKTEEGNETVETEEQKVEDGGKPGDDE